MANKPGSKTQKAASRRLSEDWLAVLVAASIILLSLIGILGEKGLNITF